MKEFSIGDRCRFAGLIVTVRSIRAKDGRYLVEDLDNAFFHAHHNKLLPIGIEYDADHTAPFSAIASRAAMFAKGRVKGKQK